MEQISGLLRQRKAFAVNFFENNIAASTEKGFTDLFAQAHGIVALAGFAQNFGSIGMGYERVQTNPATFSPACDDFGKGSDRNLAAAAEFVEQSTLAGGGGAGGGVIEKCQERSCCLVAVADFDS